MLKFMIKRTNKPKMTRDTVIVPIATRLIKALRRKERKASTKKNSRLLNIVTSQELVPDHAAVLQRHYPSFHVIDNALVVGSDQNRGVSFIDLIQ